MLTLSAEETDIQVSALILADHIYQDIHTQKFILSGVFHQINVPAVPFMVRQSLGVFLSFTSLEKDLSIVLKLTDKNTSQVLTQTGTVHIENPPGVPVSVGFELPPFTIHHAGKADIKLEINGNIVHEMPLFIQLMAQ